MTVRKANAKTAIDRARLCLRLCLAIPLIIDLSVMQSPAQQSAKSEIMWQGQTGGFFINWTTSDIVATTLDDPVKHVFSARTRAADLLRSQHLNPSSTRSNNTDWPFRSYYLDYTVLSAVGSFLSLKETEVYSNPGAYVTDKYMVIDLRAPRKKVRLGDLFPDRDLLHALLADPIVKNALKQIGKPKRPPRSSAALIKLLWDWDYDYADPRAVSFRSLLDDFAFHHIENEKIAVRLPLYFQAGMRNDSYVELGLLLPIPEALRPALEEAERREQGFLMKDSKAISRGRSTTIYFGKQYP